MVMSRPEPASRSFRPRLRSLALAVATLAATPAHAEDAAPAAPLTIEASYTADLSAVAAGPQTGTRFTGIGRITADLALDDLLGWTGAALHAQGIVSSGGRPNDLAGTLQGVNNIEVAENRAKLFEFYLDQTLGGNLASVRLGFADLNAEFYATEASGLLIAPAFGIGSELSATGPNGPSLFPSTALTARIRLAPTKRSYVLAGVFNAEAGVLGDRGGVRPLFGKGALLIGEAGHELGDAKGKLALGGWTYTARQEDLRDLDPTGSPVARRAYGVYALGEAAVDPRLSVFARIGLSDGRSTPYQGGWQLGLLSRGLIKARPEGELSLGVYQALLTRRFRANLDDAGTPAGPSETGLELTWSDQVAPWLRLQPDAQFIRTAMRGAQARNALVFTLRANIALSSGGQE